MGNLDILNQNLLPTVTCHYLAANANEKLKFVKNHQNFCSNLCRCDVCVTADYAASNCTEFTIVGGRVLYITSFKFVQKIDKQSKIILKIQNLTVPCCHSEVNIDDTAWWGAN